MAQHAREYIGEVFDVVMMKMASRRQKYTLRRGEVMPPARRAVISILHRVIFRDIIREIIPDFPLIVIRNTHTLLKSAAMLIRRAMMAEQWREAALYSRLRPPQDTVYAGIT